MQETRSGVLTNAATWVEQTYSSLRVDAYIVFIVLSLVVALLCAGAYQEAVRQAHTMLNMQAPQDPNVMQVVDLVNQYGLALLVAICYFSNVTDKGIRREMMIDGITIAIGVLLPQLVFHATTVWFMQNLAAANNLMVNSGAIAALNMEWMFVWGISMALVGLALLAWRAAHHRSPMRR